MRRGKFIQEKRLIEKRVYNFELMSKNKKSVRQVVYNFELMYKNKKSVRQIAYKNIYLKNKEDYSLPFKKYDIHHKDRDKDNNRTSNLDIVTRDEHEQIHNLGLRGEKELYEYKEISEFFENLHRERKENPPKKRD